MSGVSKKHFIIVNANPTGSQPSREVSTNSRREELDCREPPNGENAKRFGGHAAIRPGRDRDKPNPGPQRDKHER